jgi:hypothetical protein
MSYAWIIDVDHICDPGEKSDVGRIGPRNAPDELIAQLQVGAGIAFQLKDDDGELNYEGRIFDAAGLVPYSDNAFAPLDDFGQPNAGCTEIWYKANNGEGAWEQL